MSIRLSLKLNNFNFHTFTATILNTILNIHATSRIVDTQGRRRLKEWYGPVSRRLDRGRARERGVPLSLRVFGDLPRENCNFDASICVLKQVGDVSIKFFPRFF